MLQRIRRERVPKVVGTVLLADAVFQTTTPATNRIPIPRLVQAIAEQRPLGESPATLFDNRKRDIVQIDDSRCSFSFCLRSRKNDATQVQRASP